MMSQLESLYEDQEILDELQQRRPGQQMPSIAPEMAHLRETLGSRQEMVRGMAGEEAIILAFGRPSLLIRQNTIDTPESETWQRRLKRVRGKLEARIPAVGRVELFGHDDYEWVGTAWLVDDRTFVTNRHVANIFAEKSPGGELRFRRNSGGDAIRSAIDFREEHDVELEHVVEIERVTYLADFLSNSPDIAFLRVRRGSQVPEPIPLASTSADEGQLISVIGYPAWDGRRNGVDEMKRIFGDIFNVKRLAPGYVTSAQAGRITHDASTLGGNSGSPIINAETGEAIGLHFAGRFLSANHGVDVAVIKDLLHRSNASVSFTGNGDPVAEEARTADYYADREGYAEDFFGNAHERFVPLPQLSAAQQVDAAKIRGRTRENAFILDYTHFSCVINGKRKLPVYTAVNIDGASLRAPRRRNTRWRTDPRISRAEQAGNELYRRNRLDRGHMVRRLDPVWGPADEAQQAEEDTFHYTNAAPQHERLNQHDWVQLEDHLLDALGEHGLKATVFTGPVFHESDRPYRGVPIPEAFWKVVALLREDDTIHVTAYLLGQAAFLTDIEFAFGEFKTFQTSVAKIEELTDLDFGQLRNHDPLHGTESASELEIMDNPAAALGI
ncbi:MAG: DNA/RNA non-specific endonuclease [Planctomycetota bacterium]